MYESFSCQTEVPAGKRKDVVISQIDGSMLPLVEMPSKAKDKRKKRQTLWKEAKLCMSRGKDEVNPIFRATMLSAERAGELLLDSAIAAGMTSKTHIHGIGDGALWIREQFNRVFGSQASFLNDFYHTSEYLAKAAEHSWTSKKSEWLKEAQDLLKENKYQKILRILRKRLPENFEEKKARKKKGEVAKQETPVEKCYRYLNNRKDCLDYKNAIEKELPIGSGEIEGGHRHVIQKRLKISGAWWKEESAEYMLHLRTIRANKEWSSYWQSQIEENIELKVA